jgi:glycine cleavage system H protein
MSQVKDNLRYSEEHEWVEVSGNKARIGITDFAQHELGDIVFVELPEVGDTISANEPFG